MVLTHLCEVGFTLKPKKYSVCLHGTQGVSTDPAKIENVKSWQVLRNCCEVQQFLGLASLYYRNS